MVDVAKLSVVIDADTGPAEAGLSSLNTKLGSTGSMLSTAFGGAAIAGVAALGAGLVATVSSAAEFEKQMSAISAVSGATDAELDALTKTALQLGKDTSFSAQEAAAGMEELVKAGVSVEDTIGGGAKGALDLAAAGAVSVSEAAEIAANAMNVFSLKGSDMGHVADVIAGAANASAISVTDYKFSLSAAGAVAATVGIGFEDLSTAIAAMGNAGIKGSDAGTSLKTMLMNLQPSTNAQRDEFRRLGLETNNLEQGLAGVRKLGIEPLTDDWPGLNNAMASSLGLSADVAKWTSKEHDEFDKLSHQLGATGSAFFDANGKAKGMADIAQVLQDATKDMTEAQRLASLEVLFGSDAIRAAAVLSKEGAAGMNELAASYAKMSAAAISAERLNNLAGAWEQLQGSLETAAIMIGMKLLPALTELTKWATGGINAIITQLEKLDTSMSDAFGPEVAAEVAKTLGDVQRTATVVTAAIATAFESDGARVQTAWSTQWRVVILETTARTQELLGLIRIFALAYTGDYKAMWAEIVGLTETEGKRQAAISTANADLATAVIDSFTQGGATRFREFFDDVDELVVAGWTAVLDATTTAWHGIAGALDAAWRGIVTSMGTAAEAALAPIREAWAAAQTVTETVFRAIANLLTAIWQEIDERVIRPRVEAIEAFLGERWAAIATVVETAVNAARDAIDAAWVAVQSRTSETLNAVLSHVRDAVFEPLRAAVAEKIDAARAAVQAALDGMKAYAEQVLNPMLAWWQSTIWGPMSATVETAMTGSQGAATTFTVALDTMKSAVDTVLGAIKSVWETTWSAIQKAAESPKAAMDQLIELVEKLKSVMPEWLVPHSPTPLQIGLEGISKAAKQAAGNMASFFKSGGGADPDADHGEVASYIRNAAGRRGIDPSVAIRIAQHEGGLVPNTTGKFKTGWSFWPFQLHYGGKGYEYFGDTAGMGNDFTKATGWSPGDERAWQDSVDYALDHAAKHGWGAWYGRGPAGVGAWEGIPGHAEGGIFTKPHLAWIAEDGPEAVVPLGRSGGPLSSQTVKIDVAIGGRLAEEIYVTGRDLAIRRGRAPAGAV